MTQPDAPSPTLIAYKIHDYASMPIVPAAVARDWMDRTGERFAYRCLPLNIANQHGWFLLNTHKIRCVWNGRDAHDAVTIICKAGPKNAPCPAISHFGSGVVTFNLNYLFRTPPGWNLWCRGPSNHPKDGITALEGIIETDWSVATFTMNWKMTSVNVPVDFEIGEPICMICPIKRGEVESFSPQMRAIASDPALKDAYEKWAASRTNFNRDLAKGVPAALEQSWQRDYIQGQGPGVKAPQHQVKLEVKQFSSSSNPSPGSPGEAG
jgi:hypothetical protein